MRRSEHNTKLMAQVPAYRRKKMRKILLMSSALVANVLLSSGTEAACIQTPNCTTLGYTSTTACEGGLKCPWGNAWFCNIGSGTGGNSGNIAACHVGAVLNSDKSCTEGQELGKVPIGIIVYADGKGHGQAIALESIKIEESKNLCSGLSIADYYKTYYKRILIILYHHFYKPKLLRLHYILNLLNRFYNL